MLMCCPQEKEKGRGLEESVSPGPAKGRERKAKQEPELAFPPLQGGKLKVEPGEGEGLAGLGEEGGLSPTRGEMLPPATHYSLGKEEVVGQLGPHHHLPAMGLDPGLAHLPTDPSVSCNSFSVDSIMTNSRDGSPGERGVGQPLPDMGSYGRAAAWSSPSSPSTAHHYPASCLYPGQTSLEELSNMTAACLSSQGQMGGLYARQPWYAMPGSHSPSALLPEHAAFPRAEYFEPAAGKPGSPGAECEVQGYRSPGPYRTGAYYQDCEKY